MTVFAYYRVSTDKQDFENQKSGVIRYCEYKGIKIDQEVIEEGVSGKVEWKKRLLAQLIYVAKRGDLLIVSEISRLSRSMIDMFDIAKTLNEKGVAVYCIKENMEISNSALGLMVMSVFAFSAQIERERISQRTKEALQRAKENGKCLGRPWGSKSISKAFAGKEEIIQSMLLSGVSKVKIGEFLGVSRSTVARYLERSKNEKHIDGLK